VGFSLAGVGSGVEGKGESTTGVLEPEDVFEVFAEGKGCPCSSVRRLF